MLRSFSSAQRLIAAPLAAGAPVPQPRELGDPGLAAQVGALVQLHAPGRDEQERRAVQDGLGLALDLSAHQIGQRPADGGADGER